MVCEDGPEGGQPFTHIVRAESEYGVDPARVPALTAALGANHDEGLAGTFGGSRVIADLRDEVTFDTIDRTVVVLEVETPL